MTGLANEFWQLPLSRIASMTRACKLSPVDLARAALHQIERYQPILRAFVHVNPERALACAATLEKEITTDGGWRPLCGLPYGAKDIFHTRGMPTKAGSRARLNEQFEEQSAALVDAIEQAGGNLLGKTATYEYATGGPSFDLEDPPARNPWDVELTTGGSSSGSAAAVAAGLCSFALGTDTGGSLRTPASFCGVSSLRPTRGRLLDRGIIPLAPSFDTPGLIAPRVQDCAFVFHALAARDSLTAPAASGAKPFAGMCLGIPNSLGPDVTIHPGMMNALDLTQSAFRRGGGDVRPIQLSPMWDYTAAFRVLMLTEAFEIHRRNLHENPDLYGMIFRYRLWPGRLVQPEDIVRAKELATRLRAELHEVFQSVDFIALPAAAGPAPRLSNMKLRNNFDVPQLTAAFTIGENPVVTMPVTLSPEGWPLAVQIGARSGGDDELLRVAGAIEQDLSFEIERSRMRAVLDDLQAAPDPVVPTTPNLLDEADEMFLRLRDRLRNEG